MMFLWEFLHRFTILRDVARSGPGCRTASWIRIQSIATCVMSLANRGMPLRPQSPPGTWLGAIDSPRAYHIIDCRQWTGGVHLRHWTRDKMAAISRHCEIFLNENVWISLKISLKFVPKVPMSKSIETCAIWPTFCRQHFEMRFHTRNIFSLVKISLKFDPWGPIDDKSTLVQVMAWRWKCNKPLPKLMMTQQTAAYMRYQVALSFGRISLFCIFVANGHCGGTYANISIGEYLMSLLH